MWLTYLYSLCLAAVVLADSGSPVSKTEQGLLEGTRMRSWTGKEFLAFRGIPYARPPIGERRFKAPEPMYPWDGTKDATKDGPSCVQFFGDVFGDPSEDCLHLNVYTKSLNGTRPVIVFFHPGGFFAQTAKSSQFGPDYLADEDIVLVTVNSRLGTLGYFSTGDEHAVGNYGLKDQVMSLKWVKQNIGHFGGDPTSVTIAGDGTGSTAVLLHMLSPMSKGLFHKAIAMSGGVMNKWAVMDDPSKYAKRIGQLLNCDTSSSKSIVDCLNRLPAQKIQDQLHSLRERGHDPTIVYGAVVEPDRGDGQDRFLTASPDQLISQKKFAQVPLMIGITKNEWENRAYMILNNDTLRDEFNRDFDKWAPIAFYYERDTEKSKEIGKKLKKFYIGDGGIKKDSYGLGELYADSVVIHGVEQSARLLARYSEAPVYFYIINHLGKLTFSYKDAGKTIPLGVVHQDDMAYLFYAAKYFPQIIKPTDPEANSVRTLTSIWSNMAHTGNPTPSSVSFQWGPMKSDHLQYLDIDRTISMKPGLPYQQRMDIWESIYPTLPERN